MTAVHTTLKRPCAHLYATHVTGSSIQQQLFAQLWLGPQQWLENITQRIVHRLGPGHGHQQLQGLLLTFGTSQVASLQVQLS